MTSSNGKKNLLIVAGLSDYKLSTKIVGLLENPNIVKIYLVRLQPFQHAKIENVNPGRMFQSRVLFQAWKLFTLLSLCNRRKIDYIIGIQLAYHGFHAVLAGMMSGVGTVGCAIGDDIYDIARKPIGGMLVRWTIRHVDRLVVLGDVAKEYANKLGVGGKTIYKILNYQDPQRFKSDGDHEKTWDLIFIGELIKRKRVSEIIRCVARLHKKLPLKLCIVGQGPEEFALKELADKECLFDNVLFIGPSDKVEQLIKKSRCLILLSRVEGVPAVAVEAAFCGVPSIMTDVGDIRSIFHDEVDCLLVPFSDPQAVDAAVIKFFENEQTRQKLCAGSLQFSERYQNTWSKKNLIQCWDQVLT